MSQAKLSRVRAKLRHHRQLEGLLIAEGCATGYGTFDVALALDLAHQLIDGVGRRRVGRRLLAEIKDLPPNCQGLATGEYSEPSEFDIISVARARPIQCIRGWLDPDVIFAVGRRCPACQCTGRNRRGKLPPIVWSPAVRRKLADANSMASRTTNGDMGLADWQRSALDTGCAGPGHVSGWPWMTRVCPRGEHRQLSLEGQELYAHGSAAWYGHRPSSRYAASPEDQAERVVAWEHATSRLPAWRRGEIEHARQRRAR